MAKKTGLGQGVGLLFSQDEDQEMYFECPVEQIAPNKHQPRTVFDEEGLEELTSSIRESGIIQPLIVTPMGDDQYELIAGERRLRAAKRVGLEQVPVVVRIDVNDDDLLELAVIENVQRRDLNAVEEAEAYEKLIEKFGYTQEQAAKKVGKSRSAVANLLRLLQLPGFVKGDLQSGILSEGHARSLLRLMDDPVLMKEVRDQIVDRKLSVRQTEKLIRKSLNANRQVRKKAPVESETIPASYSQALSNQLTNHLNSKVAIVQNGTRGKLEIEYYSLDDLERLIEIIEGGRPFSSGEKN
ncbi:MAG: ParB/RepB/Spo0J family partition protein [Desulfobulbaceae bacterium]|uniref:ParB/RepB/Spo0J family partition protein n=1 Tax=Candidatus Desulfatifera sulfidica TaxID=2841691 RepID=A0A8J6TDX7_9BACT|nr:ParB/RepB/Spo0J family partition protein [Candidatus Desulfatifera sulfidica]